MAEDDILTFEPAGDADQGTGDAGTEGKEAGDWARQRRRRDLGRNDPIGFLEGKGFDVQSGLRYAAGSEEFYFDMLASFVEEAEERAGELDKCFHEQNWADYRIRVHALKSASRMVGANRLADIALAHETAAKEGWAEEINAGYRELAVLYRTSVNNLRQAVAFYRKATEPEKNGAQKNAPTQKVLVVDDEPIMLAQAKRALEGDYIVIAVESGEEGIAAYEREEPDLIISDMLMPGMTGFEMQKILQQRYGQQIAPIVFMTGNGDDDAEGESLDVGAADFIRKPFHPAVMLRRVKNILDNIERMRGLEEAASIDQMTGLLNKAGAVKRLTKACREGKGVLMILDLDSFKLVNDTYGHEMGDRILEAFADMIRDNMRNGDIAGRIGGDEFILFCAGSRDVHAIEKITKRINEQLVTAAKQFMGEDMDIPLGTSVGAVFVPESGSDYDDLFKLADRALYIVKRNGKHGYFVYDADAAKRGAQGGGNAHGSLKTVSRLFEERNILDGAFCIGPEAFVPVYRYFIRYVSTYSRPAYKVLFTLTVKEDAAYPANEATEHFGDIISQPLRKSDVLARIRENQFFLLLPEITKNNLDKLINRILAQWKRSEYAEGARVSYEVESVQTDDGR